MDDLIEALNIFRKYMNGYALKYPTMCEHDMLIINVDPNEVSQEDDERLNQLGFDLNQECGTYASFRYGSA